MNGPRRLMHDVIADYLRQNGDYPTALLVPYELQRQYKRNDDMLKYETPLLSAPWLVRCEGVPLIPVPHAVNIVAVGKDFDYAPLVQDAKRAAATHPKTSAAAEQEG